MSVPASSPETNTPSATQASALTPAVVDAEATSPFAFAVYAVGVGEGEVRPSSPEARESEEIANDGETRDRERTDEHGTAPQPTRELRRARGDERPARRDRVHAQVRANQRLGSHRVA